MVTQETIDRIYATAKNPVDIDTDPDFDDTVFFKSSVYTPDFQNLVKEFGTRSWFSHHIGFTVYD